MVKAISTETFARYATLAMIVERATALSIDPSKRIITSFIVPIRGTYSLRCKSKVI